MMAILQNSFQKNVFSFLQSLKSNIIFILVLGIDIGEFVSYYMMKAPINTQAVNAVNVNQMTNEVLAVIWLTKFLHSNTIFFFTIIFVIIAIFLPFYKYVIPVSKTYLILHACNMIFLFLFFLIILSDFHDENNKALLDQDISNSYFKWLRKLLIDKVSIKPQVLKTSPHLKNLIHLESYPNEYVKNPKVSPNLHNFSQKYEYVAPVAPVPYSAWTIGATVLMETGIPQIMPDTDWNIRGKIKVDYFLKTKGIPDFLNSLGYNMHFATVGDNKIMGFSLWENEKNFTRIYTAKTDYELLN